MGNKRKWDYRFLSLAKEISGWAKDPSTKVGAVIADELNRVVSIGYNGFPVGIDDDHRLENRDDKLSIVIHAEENALLFSQRPLAGCTLYCTLMPCTPCASKIIQSGITRVVYQYDERIFDDKRKSAYYRTTELFDEAGIELQEYK